MVCLLASKITDGVFHRANLMSGPLRDLRERLQTSALLATSAEAMMTTDRRKMRISRNPEETAYND